MFGTRLKHQDYKAKLFHMRISALKCKCRLAVNV